MAQALVKTACQINYWPRGKFPEKKRGGRESVLRFLGMDSNTAAALERTQKLLNAIDFGAFRSGEMP